MYRCFRVSACAFAVPQTQALHQQYTSLLIIVLYKYFLQDCKASKWLRTPGSQEDAVRHVLPTLTWNRTIQHLHKLWTGPATAKGAWLADQCICRWGCKRSCSFGLKFAATNISKSSPAVSTFPILPSKKNISLCLSGPFYAVTFNFVPKTLETRRKCQHIVFHCTVTELARPSAHLGC